MTTFSLKILAVIFMFIDHVGFYFEDFPVVFRLLGRLSYPLFLFCMVWGYHYTKNRKIYLIRLYIMSLFMTIFGYIVDLFMPTDQGFGNHNIFLPMFIICILISTIEQFRINQKKGYIYLCIIFLVQFLYYLLPSFIPCMKLLSGDIITGIIPNMAINEYGLEFIILGVAMYFTKEDKQLFSVVYIIFCISQFSIEMLENGISTQWIMIFSLPFMQRYNNKKGAGLKYFFYIFYPLHLFVLFYLSNTL